MPIRNVSPSLSPLSSSSSSLRSQSAILCSCLSFSSAPSLTLVCAVRQEAHSLLRLRTGLVLPRLSQCGREVALQSFRLACRPLSCGGVLSMCLHSVATLSYQSAKSAFFQHSHSSRLRLQVSMRDSVCFFTILIE